MKLTQRSPLELMSTRSECKAAMCAVLVGAALIFLSTPAHAVTMYAGAYQNDFVSIETNPLAETLIEGTTTSADGFEQIAGLAFQPGTNILFASTGGGTGSASPGSLYTVDIGTGALTLVGGINRTRVVSLAFAANGDLYGSEQNSLLKINPADATFTTQGSFGLAIAGNKIAAMDFSPLDGLLYAVTYGVIDDNDQVIEAGELGTVDLTSGAFSSLGVLTEAGGQDEIGFGIAGMTFDAAGNLYVAKGDVNGDMYQIDIADVEYTFLGNTHDESVTSLAAIVPEPSTLILALFGFSALAAWKRQRITRHC